MDFKSVFLNSLISAPKLPAGQKPEIFLGQVFPWESGDIPSFFKLLSCGVFRAQFPWSFDIRTLDCFLFLHTKKGCGKLLLDGQVYLLDAESFLLLDCSQHFRIDIAKETWEYGITFFTGNILPHYRRFFPKDRFYILHTSAFSDLSMGMDSLLAQLPTTALSQKLTVADLLNHMTTLCLASFLKEEEPALGIPPYLEQIRTLFDQHFQEAYTLDELAKRFGISKYKICRDFGAAYGITPLQYLNRQRIRVAGHLLLTTDHRIYTIGSMVGIDNTNHFIFLFKKFTGLTPLEYKQRMAT